MENGNYYLGFGVYTREIGSMMEVWRQHILCSGVLIGCNQNIKDVQGTVRPRTCCVITLLESQRMP